MSILQLTVLAVAAMSALAALRLVRVHLGRTPLPEERGRWLFRLLFVIVPPVAVGAGLTSVPIYAAIVGVLVVLMWIAATIVGQLTNGQSGRYLRLALVGSEGDRDNDPPLTAPLTESLVTVDAANAVFPRGREFPAEIDRMDFRVDWDALDAATRTLEGLISDDYRLGLGVASRATATATDARSRLNVLRLLAEDHGQAWAAA